MERKVVTQVWGYGRASEKHSKMYAIRYIPEKAVLSSARNAKMPDSVPHYVQM